MVSQNIAISTVVFFVLSAPLDLQKLWNIVYLKDIVLGVVETQNIYMITKSAVTVKMICRFYWFRNDISSSFFLVKVPPTHKPNVFSITYKATDPIFVSGLKGNNQF